ncbi:site-specific tyrosine recombinase XerD [Propionibacteriaceae bacterium Y1685]|uniref:site-specific tyrosine recombinase XerD n=1 Tax=Microlunatus sp. Y1700 TaxID=3418487 RepID=UPI003B7F4783
MARLVRGYLDHLTVERGVSEHTISGYRRDLDRYLQHLAEAGVEEIDQVTAGHIADFAAALREGRPARGALPARVPLAVSSTARAVVAVRSFHRFAVEEGEVAEDVAAAVQPPSGSRRLPKAISQAEVQRLLDVPDRSTPIGLRDALLFELLYGTGARISEIIDLDVDDVTRLLDDPEGELGLRVVGKGDKERIVPVGSYARRACADWLVRGRPVLAEKARSGAGPALLLNARGQRMSRQGAWNSLQSAAEAAELEVHVSPHTLRHSFATHMLDGGADVRVVQEILGHASVTTTQIYTLVTVDHLREVYLTSHPRAR